MYQPATTDFHIVDLPLFPQQTILSKAELRVLKYMVYGYSSKQIAYQLNLSSRTIDDHRKHIYAKLKVNNPVEVTRIVYQLPLSRNVFPPHQI